MEKNKPVPTIAPQKDIDAAMSELPGWSYKNDMLSKEYEFKTFMDGIRFVDSLAPFFESIDHHADMHIMYNKIRFDLQRFDVGGKVTNLDIQEAKEIEKRYTNLH